ncbi:MULTISPECIES: hypothetical protein [Paenarthrobacter]|jgi:hypothetical protein|uniref:hypothetical protein n=1 Tax=Paenarthrobacter TaxID=1742992 RepID=UPI0006F3CB73|nr:MULTISPECIES: hypothetical protein [Paenarthrobacter]KQR00838.1 hypothetical protein ASF74_20550 [Arthrobacter sp. Leaf145]QOT23331.1 hypothetical protein HMI60_18355 [Paenarthrobacter sp. YJN-D]UKE98892.1 hypothetical protein LU808_18270 [Paenarthrobacter nicotinovorans]UKF03681.1 hypothetical protein JMY29_18305 [Paenarthrobacter nicotinovorans]
MASMTAGSPTGSTAGQPRITVEVPVLRIGGGQADYEGLKRFVDSLRKPQGLHMTLLHVGILHELADDIAAWTKGRATPERVLPEITSWLTELPVLQGFLGKSDKVVPLGGGRLMGLEVDVPQEVHDYQALLVQGLHVLLDDLGLDNIDDFILGSPALGYRSPRWLPHIAVGRARSRHEPPVEIAPVAIEFGDSRIRNRLALPGQG